MAKENAIERHGFNPNTVFSDILVGKLPAEFIHKDELVTAFLDIQPITDGHVLVIPNKKAASLDELKPEYGERMFNIAQKVALALKKTNLACEGINFFLADGQAAGQTVFHLHLHVFPRFEGDGFGWNLPNRYYSPPEPKVLSRHCEEIKKQMK